MRESERTRRASGLGVTVLDGHKAYEDFYVCFHCQRTTFVRPREDPAELGGLCKICMRMICKRCVAKERCDPWEKQMERAEAKQRFLNSAGLGG
jgi:hypothetical protein